LGPSASAGLQFQPPADLLSSRLSIEDEEKLTSEQKHADLLEKVIKFGLNQSQYLIEVQVR
jgi:hypothetical protein